MEFLNKLNTHAIMFTGSATVIKICCIPSVNLMTWAFVAILLDLFAGVAKAVKNKSARTSEGFRRTVSKFSQYVGSLAGVFIIMQIGSNQHWEAMQNVMSWAADGLLIFIIYIEVFSVFENLNEIDKKSQFSRFFLRPMLAILSLSIKNNPFTKIAEQQQQQ